MAVLFGKPLECGNGYLIEQTARRVLVKPEMDDGDEFSQWFYFVLCSSEASTIRVDIDVSKVSFGGFENFRPFVCNEEKGWSRHDATLENGILTLELDLLAGFNEIAYFEPYCPSHLSRFLDKLSTLDDFMVSSVGSSVSGRDLPLVKYASPTKSEQNLWVIARQHSGEVMGSWFVEGFIKAASKHRGQADLSIPNLLIVPMVNIDGCLHGNIRTNAAGADLNRSWKWPVSDFERTPEVYAILEAMHQYPPSLFLDIHGVEDLSHCFLMPPEGPIGQSPKMAGAFEVFETLALQQSVDLQAKHRFPFSGDLRIASTFVTEHFDCLGVTLEMPFNDATHNPDGATGWSPKRSSRLGQEFFQTCLEYLASDRSN